MKLRQIVPQVVCLSCDVCCRFPDKQSAWRPVFAKEEKERIDKNLSLDANNKINLVPYKDFYICPCFTTESNRCKVYDARPFDCQLYPFLLIRKNNKIFLGIDKKCPYTKVIFGEETKKSYIDYLARELTLPGNIEWLRENPCLFGAYDEDALEIGFLFNL
jgi:Fe-S-cluster containining protein